MASNIEIKARVRDRAALELAVAGVADGPARVLTQEDVFFRVPKGRLKLRILSASEGELIYYERPDVSGVRQSHYEIARTTEPAQWRKVLGLALGESVVVKKVRRLLMCGQTRIHLDAVEGLGNFVELEVVLRDGQDPAEGHAIARELMARLGVGDEDLVPQAYADMLAR